MIQLNYIDIFNNIFVQNQAISAVLLIGSFGRKKPKANSDIDYQIVVSENFDNQLFLDVTLQTFGDTLQYYIYLPEKRKWCFYLGEDLLIVEVFVCYQLSEIDKYFLGSEIETPDDALVFDNTGTVLLYLDGIIRYKKANFNKIQQQKAEYHITNFQNRFEAMSSAHAKSDGYKFSVLFGHALNAVVQIVYLCESDGKFSYMPPNFLTDYSYPLKLSVEKNGYNRLANS